MDRRPYYEPGVGKRHRLDGPTRIKKRNAYLELQNAINRRNTYDDWVVAPAVSAKYHPGSVVPPSVSHRFATFSDIVPVALFDVPELPQQPVLDASSQLIEMPKRVQYDAIVSKPKKRFSSKTEGDVSKTQPTFVMRLPKSLKGIGYCPIGNPFSPTPRILRSQFCFDLNATMGKREYTATNWRHSYAGYVDESDAVLSPALVSRTIDNVSLSTSMRDGTGFTNLWSSINLFDLELASWNANCMKLLYEPGNSSATTPIATGTLLTYNDFIPATDHYKGTPFPTTTYGSVTTAQVRRPPFLVNLGPGMITFDFMNRLPTPCEVELVCFQIRCDPTSIAQCGAGPWSGAIENYSGATFARQLQGPVLTTQTGGSGGEVQTSTTPLLDPTEKFLASYPKWSFYKSPCIERDRHKFVLSGGANKSVKIGLPAQVYNSQTNYALTGDPFAASPAESSYSNGQSYIIYVAVNGTLMPVFSAPISNTTNGVTATDFVCQSIVDKQTSPASIVVTGEYVEHPGPCLPTLPNRVFNNHPELNDTIVKPLPGNPAAQPSGDTTLYANAAYLVSGYVQDLPSSVSAGQVVSFGASGPSENKQEPMDD